MKILHCADIHARDKDLEEISKCGQKIVETAEEEHVDLIVIAGDLLDFQDTKLDSSCAKWLFHFISTLADIAPVAIVIGTPSHEGRASEILELVSGEYPVRVASRPMQVVLKDDGRLFDIEYLNAMNSGKIEAIISMIPQPTKQFYQGTDQEISDVMSGIFAGFGAKASEFQVHHILVYHGSISGASLSSGQTMVGRDIEVSRDQLELSGASLILCGHIHKAQRIGNAFYSGSIYRVDDGEMEDKGFYLHEIDSLGVISSLFIQTPCKKLIRLAADFTTGYPIEEWGDYVDENIEGVNGAFVRFDFRVFQDEAGQIDKSIIEDLYKGRGAEAVDIRIIRVPRVTVRSESVRNATTLREKVLADAEIKGEMVLESLLVKADMLQTMTTEQLMEVSL